MNTAGPQQNQRALEREFARLQHRLDAFAADRQTGMVGPTTSASECSGTASTEETLAPPVFVSLSSAFGLSSFERDLLLLCAGVELDGPLAMACARAHGDPQRPYVTFSLALATLAGAHVSAITSGSPLRRNRLLVLEAGASLTGSPLRIDERVLHALLGLDFLDVRLQGLLLKDSAFAPLGWDAPLPPSAAALADELGAYLRSTTGTTVPAVRAAQLCGQDEALSRAIAGSACARLALPLYVLRAIDVPQDASEREALCRLWHRESRLSPAALLLLCRDGDSDESKRVAGALVDRLDGPILVIAPQPLRLLRAQLQLDVVRPSRDEQRQIWQQALGTRAKGLDGQLERVISHFHLDFQAVHTACQQLADGEYAEDKLVGKLWDACRLHARTQLDALAQRIEPAATWEDLVLPEQQRSTLREIVAQKRHQTLVYDQWGFGKKGSRGLGISVLFTGSSGTGKTLSAEVLAMELGLDLYRVDLSQLVSKYIGETEKNLRRVFDAADQGGVILLFDEADALFGKRSEVKDSHDRYANIEVSYLLQRMEAYQGISILTSNMRAALDTAFLRRLRFVVAFPFPDLAQRTEIWRRVFPIELPRDESIDPVRLARLNLAGGHIRNIALGAAFLAAAESRPLSMRHIVQAARCEYAKLDKPFPEAELGTAR